jgi:hypothetical protein
MPQKPDAGHQSPPSTGIIAVRLREMSQLFDALDPSPFHEKDLDRRAEEYVVESAKELPRKAVCSLRVIFDEPTGIADERDVEEAIRAHFARRSRVLRRELRQLLRRGWISLGIGVAFLAIVFVIAQVTGRLLGESSLATLFREGLVIVGWVAMWRPLEIFLYDWWPIVGQRRLFDRLSAIPVRIVPSDPGALNWPAAIQSAHEATALARWEGEGGRVLAVDQSPDSKLPAQSMINDSSMPQSVYVGLTLVIQAALVIGLVLFLVRRDWENVFLTLTVIALDVVPAFIIRRHRIYVPPEFQLIALAFVFLALFLGSARDFYYRFWWWDMVLHAGSGFLFGIVGWIVLFLLLQTDRLPRGIGPGLVCVFGVTFAVTLGVLWEVFEFAVDSVWPHLNMMSNETGVADTMHDLIVDTVGAILVGFIGWAYSRTGKYSFLVDAVRGFMRRNPHLFRKRDVRSRS